MENLKLETDVELDETVDELPPDTEAEKEDVSPEAAVPEEEHMRENVTRLPVGLEHAADDVETAPKSDPIAVQNPIGDELKSIRMDLGEDLRTIAASLKIRRQHLEALETGDLDALPGRAYAIGFVRSYADYLGMDGEQAVQRFKTELDGPKDEAEDLHFPEPEDEIAMPQGSLVIIGLLLVAAVIGGLQLSAVVDRMLTERSEQETAASVEPTAASSGLAGQVSSDSAEDAGVAVAADSAVQPSAPVTQVPPANAEASFADARIILQALEATWLRVDDTVRGTVLREGSVRAGDRIAIPDRSGLVLATRNGGALEVFVDGVSVGRAGDGILAELNLSADQLVRTAQ